MILHELQYSFNENLPDVHEGGGGDLGLYQLSQLVEPGFSKIKSDKYSWSVFSSLYLRNNNLHPFAKVQDLLKCPPMQRQRS